MKRIVVHPDAERELRELADFYERNGGVELSNDFDICLRSAFRVVAEDPERFPRVILSKKVQKCKVNRFPFSVYYSTQKERVWILAVAHHKRHHAYWRRRLL